MTWTRGRLVSLALLAVIIAIGVYLRFDALGQPSYWLDEVLGDQLTTNALAQPWWRWLIGFEAEHGPLYYATQFATRIAGRDEFAGRLAAALFGLMTIPLTWLAARGAAGSQPAEPLRRAESAPLHLAAAALLALSPLHVYYSREARPYALLMLLTAALLIELLRDDSPWRFSVVLAAMLYTSAVAAPVVAAAAVVAYFASARRRLAIPAILATVAFLLLYRSAPHAAADVPAPELDATFFMTVVRALTVSAFGADIRGRAVIALCVFALIGAIAMTRRNRRGAFIVITMTVLPILFAVGTLKLFGHWFATRYICASVIGFVILAGAGIAALASIITRRREALTVAVTLIIVVAIGWQTWDTARREPFQKLDWRRVAAAIARVAKPGDLVLAAEPSTGIVLPDYLERERRDLEIRQMSFVPLAELMVAAHPAWLVSTGSTTGPSMRQWMCRYPMVLGSALDGFRLHYASRSGDFLRERGRPAELRAMAAGLGPRGFMLEMRPEEDSFFINGWAAAEGAGSESFRWAIGTSASVTIPRWGSRDRVVRVRVLPMHHPSLPLQTMRVSLNGNVVADLTLEHKWSELTLAAPARFWIDGLNTLTFTFGRARAPIELDPAANDSRPLAAAFDWIAVQDSGALAVRPVGTVSLRIADAFIDEKTAWRDTPTRLPHQRLQRDSVEALLGRLGFDPQLAWPRLERGELDLDDLMETIAYGSDCEDDRAYVVRMYGILLERAPTDPEMQSLLSKLRSGNSRAALVAHIVKAPELRARYML